MYKCKHFKIYELVSKKALDHYGETKCWQFLDEDLLRTFDKIREMTGRAITVNTWYWGGRFSQRGWRANLDDIPYNKTIKKQMYNGFHNLGKAGDFDIKGWSAEKSRKWILENQEHFPYITYMEDKVNWVHIDGRQSPHKGIYLFRP